MGEETPSSPHFYKTSIPMLIVFLLGAVSNDSLSGSLDWLAGAAIFYLAIYAFYKWNRNHPGALMAMVERTKVPAAIRWIAEKLHIRHHETRHV